MILNELRVGSLVKVFPKPGETVFLRIKEIHKETIVGEFYKSPGFYLRASFKDLNAIEFSDEWLPKAGFQESSAKWELNEYNVNCTLEKQFTRLVIKKGDREIVVSGLDISTVHQFQNIYAAVSGIDLNIAYSG